MDKESFTNKDMFLQRLSSLISDIPEVERQTTLDFYNEIISDRIENGEDEEKIIEDLGDISTIANKINSEYPKVLKSKTPSKVFGRVALILGSPIWFALALSFAAVIFSLFISAWAVIISLYSVVLALALSSVVGIISSFLVVQNSIIVGIFQIGICLVCAGLAVLLFLGCTKLSKLFITFTKFSYIGIKSMVTRKGGAL